MSTRATLLHRAAQCYERAGLIDDACRCMELSGDYLNAARLHEQHERWEKAAQLYRRSQAWREAARCFQECRMPAEAAQCLLNIKDYLHAAWLFAEHAGLFNRARSVLREVNPENVVEELTYDVIMARCEKGNGLASTAVELLNAVITRFGELDKGPDRRRIEEWTMAVIKHLGRPDLSAAMFAAAYAAGFHEVEQRWEDWALQNLGDAAGVPSTDDSPDRDGRK